ncbi:MFS transporter [Leifsonia sp. NPDC058230]|uniref:MFS transporter n=1 Tax=Leifsonia sp. NPDC058230 TaxID=3346391 RepID=UPI0036DC15DA
MSKIAPPVSARARTHRAALPVLLCTQLLIAINVAVVNVGLTGIQHDLHYTPATLSWVVNAYLLAYGGFLIVGGRLGDIIGRRRAMVLGLSVFTVAVVIAAVVPGLLILARALQGLGAALASPAVLAVITNLYEGRARSRALGWFSVVTGVGLSAGMIFGGIIVQWLDWRWIFILNIPVAVVLVVLNRTMLPALRPEQRGRLDLLGAVLATLAALGLVFGFVELGAHVAIDAIWIIAFAVAALALIGLVAHLRRATNPLLPVALFMDPARVGAFVANALLGGAVTGVIFFLSEFFGGTLHLAPIAIGAAFLFLTVPQLPTALTVSRAIHRIGVRAVVWTSTSLMLVGILLLVPLDSYTSLNPVLALAMVLIGLGVGGVFFAINTTVMSTVEPHIAGGASGMLGTSLQLGGSVGIAILVLAQGFGGMTAVMSTAAAFVVISMLALSLRRRVG